MTYGNGYIEPALKKRSNSGRYVYCTTSEPDTQVQSLKKTKNYKRHASGHMSQHISKISEQRHRFGGLSITVYAELRALGAHHPPVRAEARVQPLLRVTQCYLEGFYSST